MTNPDQLGLPGQKFMQRIWISAILLISGLCQTLWAAEMGTVLQELRKVRGPKGGEVVLERKEGEWRVTSFQDSGPETILTDDDLKRISALATLERLGLQQGIRATRDGWRNLQALHRLTDLSLPCSLAATALKGGWIDLGALPSLRRLTLPFRCSDEALNALVGFTSLESLSYYEDTEGYNRSKLMTDASLSKLKEFPDLRRLVLPVQGVDDASLKYITGLKNLDELSLIGSHIGDTGVPQLVGLVNLRSLTLNSVDEKGVAVLKSLPRLENLQLSDSTVQMLDLSGLNMLQSLTLGTDAWSFPWGKPVRWPGNLRSLCMSAWDKGDQNAAKAALEHPIPGSVEGVRLRLFHHDDSCVTPRELAERKPSDLKWLEALPNLTSLELADPTAQDFEAVLALGRLRRLVLIGNRGTLTADDVGKVRNLPQLQSLKIDIEYPVTDATIDAISTIKGLRELDAGNTLRTTTAGLSKLWAMQGLETLRLCVPKQSAGASDKVFAGIGALTALRELALIGSVTDEALNDVAGLKKLCRLDVSRSDGFSDKTLAELVKSLPELNTVLLSLQPERKP